MLETDCETLRLKGITRSTYTGEYICKTNTYTLDRKKKEKKKLVKVLQKWSSLSPVSGTVHESEKIGTKDLCMQETMFKLFL